MNFEWMVFDRYATKHCYTMPTSFAMVLTFSRSSTFLRLSWLQNFEAESGGSTTIFLEHFVDERSLIFWWYT